MGLDIELGSGRRRSPKDPSRQSARHLGLRVGQYATISFACDSCKQRPSAVGTQTKAALSAMSATEPKSDIPKIQPVTERAAPEIEDF